MKILLLCFCISMFSSCVSKPISELKDLGSFYEVEANPKEGFNYPFFLWMPPIKKKNLNLLVMPNNSGSSAKEFEAQYRSAKREILSWTDVAEQTSSVLLVPAFYRPDVDPPLYTHSLSRSTLEIQSGDLKRIDLQLIRMIEKAKIVLASLQNKPIRNKVFLMGFSASAMFVNRFSFIHPDLVEAVAFGAPGGWPLAPVDEFKGHRLKYPIGISDIGELTATKVDLEKIKQIPMFIFIGEEDANDSVVYRDGYTKEDETLVFKLFGKTPVQRWPSAEELYKNSGMNARFKIYKGIGHGTNKKINDEIAGFFDSIKQ